MVLSKTASQTDVSVHSTFASRYVRNSFPKFKMPEDSIPKKAAFQIINDELMLDGNPRLNLSSFVTTWMEPECNKLIMDAINNNYVDMDEYPVTTDLQVAVGVGTVGSSEAIMLAGLAFKRSGKISVKQYFEVELKEVKLREGYYVKDPVKAVEMVDENTVCVAAILGSTLKGKFVDVKILNDLLMGYPTHADAASGGFIAPFMYPELEWDFRLPLVKIINVSGHKYGLVYAGIGCVIWRSKEDLPEELIFHINYLGADQPTFTLNFSKGYSQVIAQYYQLTRLGHEGYKNVMENCHENVMDNKRHDEFEISEMLLRWIVPAYTMPADAQHITVLRVVIREDFSRTLAERLVLDIQKVVHELDALPAKLNAKQEQLKNGSVKKTSIETQREITAYWKKYVTETKTNKTQIY
ncbi:Glutamate decarboxylase 1 [Hibiscus syriacus]|uniref:glutamate decarboxylase n=1 Tax=Hibiscus syriacus TaxID=106335 RepID=A0A6A3BP55_HIBSY|nr:Glutamate decarboxylase 1 [Hibiscus syriacus]